MATGYYIPTDIDELETLVIHLSALYDVGEPTVDFDGEDVSDPHYDELVSALKVARPTSKAFDGISPSAAVSTVADEGDLLVTHKPPMTSIAKADTEKRQQIYDDWIARCCRELKYPKSHGMFAQSFKLDGVAVRLYYEKGKLVRAGMRPRSGIKGTDVTANVKYVKGVPQTLPLPLTLAIGGEVICLKSDFKLVQAACIAAGEDVKKNERNHAFGALRQLKDPKKTKSGMLTFMAYNITGFDDYKKYYETEVERAKWCNQVLLDDANFIQVRLHDSDDLTKMEALAPGLDYRLDGIILKVNNLEDQEQLGHHGDDETNEPHGALAWKFTAEQAQATVKEISYEASRTGRITLVANFDGVPLAGTTVKRATCNNIGWAERMGIGVGTVIVFEKGGEIIPKIVKVASGKVDKLDYPKTCPSCGGQVTLKTSVDDKKDLRCENGLCPAKHIKGMVHYLLKLECKGIGESTIEPLIRKGKIKEWADLYTLTVQDCVDCEFSARESLLALATIHKIKPSKDDHKLTVTIMDVKTKKKVVPAWQFFAALGIPQCGESAGKALIEHYGSFDKILAATRDELLAVNGLGATSADNISKFITTFKPQIERVLEHVELELPKTGKLTGINFCLSGSFDLGKEYWEKRIQDLGGNCQSSVGRKTNYLVAGPGSASKSEKAKELGTKIIDVVELEKML